MGHYLLISVRLLDGRFHGRTEDGRAAEWPPSAMRLFQALVAGAKTRWTDVTGDAFRWLETLPPPVIIAPVPMEASGRPILTYVPNNNDPPGNERTGKFIRPVLLNGDRLVQYQWTLENLTEIKNAEVIAACARHIRALGWGIDLAIGCGQIVDRATGTSDRRLVYQPSPSAAGKRLRAPAKGSLASLERMHGESLSRFATAGQFKMESAEKTFITATYASSPLRPFCAFRFAGDEDDPASYRPRQIKQLTGALRRLAAETLRGDFDAEQINGMILGHPATGPRLSILPLPSIGHPHSDGLIRRVVFAEPVGGDGSLCRKLSQALHGLTVAFEGHCECVPAKLDRIAHDTVLERYQTESRSWASVTPILLPGHNQRRQYRRDHIRNLERAHALICKAIEQSGIETGAQVEFDGIPYWRGACHARDYDPREKLAHLPRLHVKLDFERPICGPLSIGAGRHVGFGLLAACDGNQE